MRLDHVGCAGMEIIDVVLVFELRLEGMKWA